MTTEEKLRSLLKQLPRKELLEVVVGQSSSRNLIDDLIDLYGDDEDEACALIETCEKLISTPK